MGNLLFKPVRFAAFTLHIVQGLLDAARRPDTVLSMPAPLFALLAGWFGAATASFLGVVAERGWKGAAVTKRSSCICGRQLLWWENIPVFGWVLLRGVARCCNSPIPTRYVLTEISMALAVGLAALFGVLPAVAALMLSGAAILRISRRHAQA